VYFMCFIRDSLAQMIPEKCKKPIAIKEISKKVPRWPYKLINELEQPHKEAKDGMEHVDDIREILARRIILSKIGATEEELSYRIVYKRYIPRLQLQPLIKGSMCS